MLAPNTYESLLDTCDTLSGQLMWFDTTQEFDRLTERFWYYVSPHFNTGRLLTGAVHIEKYLDYFDFVYTTNANPFVYHLSFFCLDQWCIK